MRFGGTTVSLLGACVVALSLSATAGAAPTPFTAVEPLSLIGAPASPQCGVTDDVAATIVEDDSESAPYAALFALLIPRPVVALCDPARRAAGLPGLGISGTLVDARPLDDTVAAGYRQLSAAVYDAEEGDDAKTAPLRGGGLVPGDALTIPPASAGSILDVALLVDHGTSVVRFEGWADGVNAARLTVTADPASRTTVLERADGVRIERRAELLPAPTPTITAARSGKRLVVSVSGFPVGATWGELGGVDPVSTSGLTASTSTFRFRLPRKSGRRFEVSWADLPTRRLYRVSCRVTTARKVARVDRCQRTLRADGTDYDAAPKAIAARRAWATAARTARAGSTLRVRRARPLAHASAAAPRIRVELRRAGVPEASMPVGDLNGDGRAEFTDGRLWLSGPAKSVASKDDFLVPTNMPGDLNGDGLPELLLQGGTLMFSAGPWTIPSLPADALGPRVTRLRLDEDDDSQSGAGPDAIGPLADVTGDGKPELALIDEASAIVIPSEAAGVGVEHAVPSLAFLRPRDAEDAAAPDGDQSGDSVDDGLDNAPLAVGGSLHRLVVTDAATRTHPRSVATLQRLGARGNVEWQSAPLTLPGTAALADRDSISGDLLVLSSAVGCWGDTIGPDDCFTRVYRVKADGTVRASTTIDSGDSTQRPMFGPDGPDADALPELFLATYPTSIMPSGATGPQRSRDLPVLVTGKPAKPLSVSWRSDGWSPGQMLRAFPVSVRIRRSSPWRNLVFAGR